MKYFAYVFYISIAKRLPVSYSMLGVFWKKTRYICVKIIACKVGRNVNVEKGATFGRRLSIGDNSGIGIRCLLDGEIEIGDNVMMGQECIIYTQNHEIDRMDIPMCEQGFQDEKKVIIGDDVWLGARVVILPGVSIGNGCIIGAGTVVSKSFPAYSVICGNPGKIVKMRGEANE